MQLLVKSLDASFADDRSRRDSRRLEHDRLHKPEASKRSRLLEPSLFDDSVDVSHSHRTAFEYAVLPGKNGYRANAP